MDFLKRMFPVDDGDAPNEPPAGSDAAKEGAAGDASASAAASGKDVEALLSERLKEGWVLMQLCCPTCATPLVKMEADDDDASCESSVNSRCDFEAKKAAALEVGGRWCETEKKNNAALKLADESSPLGSDLLRLVTKASMDSADRVDDGPLQPVSGIPYCVACEAHVVTDATEIQSLAELGRMAGAVERGSIIVAIVKSDSDNDDNDNDSDNENVKEEGNDKHVDNESAKERDDDETEAEDNMILNPPVIAASASNNEIEVDDADNFIEAGRSSSDEDDGDNEDVKERDDDASVEEEKQVDVLAPTEKDECETEAEDEELLNPPVVAASESNNEIEVDDADNFIEAGRSAADEDDAPVGEEKKVDAPAPTEKGRMPITAAETMARRNEIKSDPPGIRDVGDESLPSQLGEDFQLESHISNVESTCADVVEAATFPPKPVASDLLDESEKEELELQQNGDKYSQVGSSKKQEKSREGIKMDDENALLEEELKEEYSVRRETATKVLGAKMLQGYTLKETQCLKCGMPLMEHKGQLDCVVCPVLVKKAKRRKREKEKLAVIEAERARKEQEAEQARIITEQKAALEEKVAKERRRMEEAEAGSEGGRKQAEAEAVAEQARILAEEKAALEEKAAEERRRKEEEAAAVAEQAAREKEITDKIRLEDEAKIVAEAKAAEEEKPQEEETKVAEQAQMDKERMNLLAEADRLERITNEKLAEELENDAYDCVTATRSFMSEDEDVLSVLEAEADSKRRAAEEAIAMAKAAMYKVPSEEGKMKSIADTIKQAEAESITNVDDEVGSHRDVDKEVDIERWDARRTAARKVLTERVLQGWVMLDECCDGFQCNYSPLISLNGGKKECVICCGSGSGQDGAYAEQQPSVDVESEAGKESSEYATQTVKTNMEPVVKAEMSKEEYEEKRKAVSREIGRRMLDGWVLLDSPCSHCAMPLMSEVKGGEEICFLCGQSSEDAATQDAAARALDTHDARSMEKKVIMTHEELFAKAMETKMADEIAKNEAQRARRRAAQETITAEEHARTLEREAEEKRQAEAVRLAREKAQREAAERAAEKARLEAEAEEKARLEAEAKRLAEEEAEAAERVRLQAEFERVAAEEAAKQAEQEAAERAAAAKAAREAAQAEEARLAALRIFMEALDSKREEADMPEDEAEELEATKDKTDVDREHELPRSESRELELEAEQVLMEALGSKREEADMPEDDVEELEATKDKTDVGRKDEESRESPRLEAEQVLTEVLDSKLEEADMPEDEVEEQEATKDKTDVDREDESHLDITESKASIQLEIPADMDYNDPEAIKELIAKAQAQANIRGTTPKPSPRRSPTQAATSPIATSRGASPARKSLSSPKPPRTPTRGALDEKKLSPSNSAPHHAIVEAHIDQDHDDISQITGWTRGNTPLRTKGKKYSKEEIEANCLDTIVSEHVVRSLGGDPSSKYASERLKEGWVLLPTLPCIDCSTPLMSPPDMQVKTALCVNENCNKCIVAGKGGLEASDELGRSSTYGSGESTEVEAWNPAKENDEDADDYDTLLEDDPDVIRLQRQNAPSRATPKTLSSLAVSKTKPKPSQSRRMGPRPECGPRPDAPPAGEPSPMARTPTGRSSPSPRSRIPTTGRSSPRSHQVGSNAFPTVVGHEHSDEASFLSEPDDGVASHAVSVASSTLHTILHRIEDAKEQLARATDSGDNSPEAVERQMEMARLIEKLSSAALAVKEIENL